MLSLSRKLCMRNKGTKNSNMESKKILKNGPFIVQPIPPVLDRPERRAIFTIAVGETFKWMFDITIPYMKQYAEKYGIDFILVDDSYRKDEHPCFMKQFINTLWWRYDRVLYVDADILILPNAPNIFEEVPADKLGIYEEGRLYSHMNSRIHKNRTPMMNKYVSLYNDELKKIGMKPVDFSSYDEKYYNAGLFICNKDTNPHRPPINNIMRIPNSGHFDQNYCNLMIHQYSIPVYELHSKWNRLITANLENNGDSDMLHSYFAHYASTGAKPKLLEDYNRLKTMDFSQNIYNISIPDKLKYNHLNIICTAHDNWILDRMTKKLIELCPSDFTCTRSDKAVDDENTINFYNVYRSFKKKSIKALDITFHSHPELKLYYECASVVDHIIVMNNQYKEELISRGILPSKISMIHGPIDEDFHNLLKLRIFNPVDMIGRGIRKGPDTWKRICQEDWIEGVVSNKKLSKAELLTEYQKADCICCTSTIEGGPMCVPEGLSMGKMVVVWENLGMVPDIDSPGLFKYKDEKHLLAILKDMHQRKVDIADCVKHLSWKTWVDSHYEVFRKIQSVHDLN